MHFATSATLRYIARQTWYALCLAPLDANAEQGLFHGISRLGTRSKDYLAHDRRLGGDRERGRRRALPRRESVGDREIAQDRDRDRTADIRRAPGVHGERRQSAAARLRRPGSRVRDRKQHDPLGHEQAAQSEGQGLAALAGGARAPRVGERELA